MSFVIEMLKNELKGHPNMFAVLVLFAFAMLGYSYKVFAQESWVREEIETIKVSAVQNYASATNAREGIERKLSFLERKLDRRHLEDQIASVDTEAYDLERLHAAGEATSRDLQRLNDLKTKHDELERDLNMLRHRSL